MNIQEDIYFGQFDLRISDLARLFPTLFENCCLLVTCLDSSIDVNQLEKWCKHLEENRIKNKRLRCGRLILTESVHRLFEVKQSFFGFDEIYLLRNDPPTDFIPNEHFTSDRYSFSQQIPTILREYIKSTGAFGILADGCGLNIALRDKALFQTLLSKLASPNC